MKHMESGKMIRILLDYSMLIPLLNGNELSHKQACDERLKGEWTRMILDRKFFYENLEKFSFPSLVSVHTS